MIRALDRKFPHGLVDWQREAIPYLDPDRLDAKEIALALTRAQGKTGWLGGLLYCQLTIPELRRRGRLATVISSSFDQAAEAGRDCLAMLGTAADSKQTYRISDQQNRFQVIHRPSGAGWQIKGSDDRRAMGLRPFPWVIIDEGSMVHPLPHAKRLFAACRGALGKEMGSKFLAVGNAPASAEHPFAAMLRNADYVFFPRGDRNRPLTIEHLRQANPSWDHPAFEAMRQDLLAKAKLAAKDSELRREFEAWHLNLGASSISMTLLMDLESYQAIAALDVEPPEADYVLGLDLSGAHSMTAAARAGLADGIVDYRAAFPEHPPLAEREVRDAVDVYQKAHAAGDLVLSGQRVVDVEEFVRSCIELWGEPAAVVCDAFRKNELLQALDPIGISDRCEFRRMGWAITEDISAFRTAAVDRRIQIRDSHLARHAFGVAEIAVGPTGNMRLVKGRGRDDLAVAICLATAQAERMRHASPVLSMAGHGEI